MFSCVNDRYDQDSNNVYDNVEDFQDMCLVCFGEMANLYQDGEMWRDETGAVVLIPVLTS